MNSQREWGILALASLGALFFIGLALWATLGASPATPEGRLVSAEPQDTRLSADREADWRRALEIIASTSAKGFADYRAPKELPKTQGVSQELIATYFALKSENKLGTEEASNAIQDLITRNISPVEPADTYTLASLKTSAATTLNDYAGYLGDAMQKSSLVREYELVTFSRTVGLEIKTGTPELRVAANVYRSIERDLVATPVPPALGPSHLELVKSVAYLARATELMAGWTGDPIDGLAYVDAFVKAEKRTRVALNDLFEAMIEFGKAP